jgi:ABC-2 type transport system permease protein
MLAAKAIAAAGLVVATMCLILAAAISLALAVLRGKGLELQFEAGQTLQSIGGMLFHVVALTILALFFGAILRSTAGGISATFGMVWVVPVLVTLVPIGWINELIHWLPDQAASRAASLPIAGESVEAGGPLGGLIATLVWLAVTGAAAIYLTHRRDA